MLFLIPSNVLRNKNKGIGNSEKYCFNAVKIISFEKNTLLKEFPRCLASRYIRNYSVLFGDTVGMERRRRKGGGDEVRVIHESGAL